MASATKYAKCCLKSCSGQEEVTSRVEVKAFAPSESDNFKIYWDDFGQAYFHRTCWDGLVKGECRECPVMTTEEVNMVREAAKTAEFFDSMNLLEREAEKIANLLKISCHAIAFTGAGISTSAGIGDYRGKGGVWTERDKAKKYGQVATLSNNIQKFTYESLRPTYTHEAIAKLVEMGILKYVLSQNVDGLHRLSGIPKTQISELHGNVFQEKCEKCETRYERKYSSKRLHKKRARPNVPRKICKICRMNHRTGGVCDVEGCGGYLMNTIINFGDRLEEPVINSALENARANDMVLCLGSTLKVTPANECVQMGNPVRLAICNRQPTPFDTMCLENGSRVYGDCDDLMRLIMKHILDEKELKNWEASLQDRLLKYALQREEQCSLET